MIIPLGSAPAHGPLRDAISAHLPQNSASAPGASQRHAPGHRRGAGGRPAPRAQPPRTAPTHGPLGGGNVGRIGGFWMGLHIFLDNPGHAPGWTCRSRAAGRGRDRARGARGDSRGTWAPRAHPTRLCVRGLWCLHWFRIVVVSYEESFYNPKLSNPKKSKTLKTWRRCRSTLTIACGGHGVRSRRHSR
jgi:hypothetical protein